MEYTHYGEAIANETFQMMIWYVINIAGWFLLGWLINTIIARLKRN